MSAASVYRFDQLDEVEKELVGGWDAVRGLLGGKGANLAEMTRLGHPGAARASPSPPRPAALSGRDNASRRRLWEQELARAAPTLEQATGKRFGDPTSPLLVSCRSGAKFSMPGMMDTVLNIGLNDETVEGLVGAHRRRALRLRRLPPPGPDVRHGRARTFATSRSRHVLAECARAAAAWRTTPTSTPRTCGPSSGASGHRPRAVAAASSPTTRRSSCGWRPRRCSARGTASARSRLPQRRRHPARPRHRRNIQAMVFGNMGARLRHRRRHDRNVSTGEHELEGDYLINAQGEDVVAGIRATQPHRRPGRARCRRPTPSCDAIARLLEKHYRDMQDIEFTIEHGKLWMLQTRDGKRTARPRCGSRWTWPTRG